MRSGINRTWYCFTSPPIDTTDATPPKAKIRGLIVQSEIVRNVSGLAVSLIKAYLTSQPTAEVTGSITGGLTPGGSLLLTC